ncbi:uncharacterized protein LOC100841188 isoform X1 [Brachypodium distachyon]|uniref:DUF4220 domain-containing protein n=1 Tax=Brachypodium distachyon TaxID=15368 RepID=I1H1I7_BRADI|nr:uncharacterized protein LOC100841188 isoform X1 [Brachypodium distachyon]KQK19834.1 hypothetical protein BRADI_1g50740v3 [Brachypodium distachyon]|eukprot:XP_003561169.1 uncharacterized protein LOC100841188 isoform X1 [Brachypodium distachyon]
MSNNDTLSGRLMVRFCDPEIDTYVNNMTKTYTDTGNEASMVAASVIMFVLAGLFFNLNLFSRFSDVSAILDPKVRLFLTSGLSLFLPVMSYLFSEAKNAGAMAALPGRKPDLSLHAGMILVWMLLVELLRKKVDEVRMRGYSGTIQRAGRVVWLGSLVFFNIRNVGRKAVFGILWVLCATKVVQRIAFTEVGKRSYACGKNSRLVSSYMSQILLQSPRRQDDRQEAPSTSIVDVEQEAGNGDAGDDLLKRSKFLVMGEEDLVIEPTADGYKLKEITQDDTVVTVGKIWSHGATGIEQANRIKRLCLSFALFKLLRQRFEHLPPVTKEETKECRDLIFKGVYNDKEDNAEAVFQMMNDEVNFLCEYYHSVIPVVLASPFFCLANYFLLPLVVLGLCIMTVVLCGQGDARYAFQSIKKDNYAMSSGIVNTTLCLLVKAIHRPQAFFTAIDFFITMLLFVILFYEEIWEFLVFLLSNWFMVSLICNYVAKPRWQRSPTFKGSIHRILWVRGKMSQPALTFKQFSILGLRWPLVLGIPPMFSLLLQTVHVPNKAKHSIIKSLMAHSSQNGNNPLNNGKSVLARTGRNYLLPACRSESIAEVILTWHIATTLMEAKCPPGNGKQMKGSATVATRLSRYCAYLVAFHPDLLPDNQEKTERVFEAAKAELKGRLGCGNYFLSCWGMRVDSVAAAAVAGDEWKDGEVVHNGAKLGNMLRGEATRDGGSQLETTWKLLADVWTELVVYLAPSSDEEHVMGHESVLVQGGEFITVLWALTTHTGISRT